MKKSTVGSILAISIIILFYQNCGQQQVKGTDKNGLGSDQGYPTPSTPIPEGNLQQLCSDWLIGNDIDPTFAQAETPDLIFLNACVYNTTAANSCVVMGKGTQPGGNPGNGFKPVVKCGDSATLYGANAIHVSFETFNATGTSKQYFSKGETIIRRWSGVPQNAWVCQEGSTQSEHCKDKANYTSLISAVDWTFSISNGVPTWTKSTIISQNANLSAGGYFYSYIYSPDIAGEKIIHAEPFIIQ